MHQRNINGIVTKRAQAREHLPGIEVLGYSTSGDATAQVTMRVVHSRFSRDNKDLTAAAIRGVFDNRVVPVPGSFVSISKEPLSDVVVGHVRVNTDVVVLDDETRKNFKSVSCNVFVDTEDKLWHLRRSASGELLVKNTGIDDEAALTDILDAHTRGMSLSSDIKGKQARFNSFSSAIEGGDFVDFVSNDSGRVEAGYVVAETDNGFLIQSVSGDAEEVCRAAVLDVHDTEEFPEPDFTEQERVNHAVSAARGTVDVQKLLDYYKLVFRRSGDFYNKFAERIRTHAFL